MRAISTWAIVADAMCIMREYSYLRSLSHLTLKYFYGAKNESHNFGECDRLLPDVPNQRSALNFRIQELITPDFRFT